LANGLQGLFVLLLGAPRFHAKLEFGARRGRVKWDAVRPEQMIHAQPGGAMFPGRRI
jgi:hypothetical protein